MEISDGSFSPSIIKLGLDAITALVESYLSPREKADIKAALIAAGAPDMSFTGILKATFKKVAGKLASDTGEALMDKASDFISPIIDAGIEQIIEKTGELFADNAE